MPYKLAMSLVKSSLNVKSSANCMGGWLHLGSCSAAEPPGQLGGRVLDLGIFRQAPRQLLD